MEMAPTKGTTRAGIDHRLVLITTTGKMVPFAGWSMPIQYKDSIMDSTKWCRTNASLFDVSHMCGLTLEGKDAISFLETLVVGDIAALDDGTGTLSVFTNTKGGIIDDTVITKVLFGDDGGMMGDDGG